MAPHGIPARPLASKIKNSCKWSVVHPKASSSPKNFWAIFFRPNRQCSWKMGGFSKDPGIHPKCSRNLGGFIGTYTKFAQIFGSMGSSLATWKNWFAWEPKVPTRKLEDQAMAWSCNQRGRKSWRVFLFSCVFFLFFWGWEETHHTPKQIFSMICLQNRAWVVKLKWQTSGEPGNSAGDLLWVPVNFRSTRTEMIGILTSN